MPGDDEQTERFLRQNLRRVAAAGGLADATNVSLVHGSLMGLARAEAIPGIDRLGGWARDEGLDDDDALRVEGIALAVRDGERNVGRLRPAAPDGSNGALLTSDELSVTRGALFLVLHGPHCNVSSHPGGGDPPSMLHTMTGQWTQDYERLMAAIDVLGSGTARDGSTRLLELGEALALVDAARHRRVRVLGIEGFEVVGASHMPRMDVILDLSDVTDPHQSAESAADFLRRAPVDLKFEIVM